MELKPALEELKKSPEFKKWFSSNNKTYFSYAFAMIENNTQSEWQIGYYDSAKNKITTFIISESAVAIKPEEDIFKKSDMDVKKIDEEKLKLPLNGILIIAEKLKKEKYPKELALKTIVIAQNLEDFGNIWNITYVTQSFSTLNIKIKADSGKIAEHKLCHLFEMADFSAKNC